MLFPRRSRTYRPQSPCIIPRLSDTRLDKARLVTRLIQELGYSRPAPRIPSEKDQVPMRCNRPGMHCIYWEGDVVQVLPPFPFF
jgi:hypothetical protein